MSERASSVPVIPQLAARPVAAVALENDADVVLGLVQPPSPLSSGELTGSQFEPEGEVTESVVFASWVGGEAEGAG
ncbi:MAG: hypothetical protein ACRDS9_24320 [Pseudonocardiaceae bacterium]